MPTRPTNPEMANPFDILEIEDLRERAQDGSKASMKILALDKHARRQDGHRKRASGAERRRIEKLIYVYRARF